MSKIIKCPLCNLNNTKLLFNIKRFNNIYSIEECKICGLSYVNPQPVEKELIKYYTKKYDYSYMIQEKESKKDKKDIRDIIKNKQGIGKLLDVGCGSGLFLLAAKEKEFKVYGVDLSKEIVKYNRNKFNLNLSNKDFLKLSNAKKYDVITMRHFLEHTTNPNKYLDKVNRLLNKNGLLFIKLPNINSFPARICGESWQWMTPPAHLFFFSPKTIKKLLEKKGFKVIKSETRNGDAVPLTFTILVSLISKLHLWEILKMSALKNSQGSAEKKDKKCTIKNMEGKIVKICSLLNIIFFPLTYVLNKFSGPEMIVYAKRRKEK